MPPTSTISCAHPADALAGLPLALLEAMPEPAALLDVAGDVVAANARWTSLEGDTRRCPHAREAGSATGCHDPSLEAIGELLSGRREELALLLDDPAVPRDQRRRLRLRRLDAPSGCLILAVVEWSGSRLWRELGIRSEHLDAVTEAMTSFLPAGDVGEAGAVLLRSAMIRTNSVAGLLAGSRGQALVVEASEGLEALEGVERRRLPRGAFAAAFARRAPLAWADGVSIEGVDGAVLAELGLRRALIVPIQRDEEPLGLLVLGNAAEPGDASAAASIDVLVRAAGVLLDAARRRHESSELERQLRGAQRIESIGRLAGGVAHDFNNLLTIILGLASLLRDDLAAEHPHARLVDEITATGRRAAALTRQLLAFSRRQVMQPELLDLASTVRSMEPLLRRLVPESMPLVLKLSPSPALVVADLSQVEQVLVNLVANARDAVQAAGGGTITIETGEADLDDAFVSRHVGARIGPHVLLAVRDTGVGMDTATASRVFEPFFTTKPAASGTGLGLSTVYGIVKQSGGSIWVDSEPGRGACFRVFLPKAQDGDAPQEREPAADEPAAAAGGETIVVVEDEPGLRQLVVHALRGHGYCVVEAGDGEQALALLDDLRVDLCVTDLVMPGMGGLELAERLREKGSSARVLFMSGYSEAIVATVDALQPGTLLLEKPFTLPALLREVRRALS